MQDPTLVPPDFDTTIFSLEDCRVVDTPTRIFRECRIQTEYTTKLRCLGCGATGTACQVGHQSSQRSQEHPIPPKSSSRPAKISSRDSDSRPTSSPHDEVSRDQSPTSTIEILRPKFTAIIVKNFVDFRRSGYDNSSLITKWSLWISPK